MKKTIIIAITVLAALTFSACDLIFPKPEVKVESITIANGSSTVLTVGERIVLTANVQPEDAADKTVVWSSSNTAVAEVTDGKVIAIRKGTAIITAASKSDSTIKCTFEVTVKEKATDPKPGDTIYATSVKINERDLVLIEGESVKLTYTMTPENANDEIRRIYSESKYILDVKEDGTITALKSGGTYVNLYLKSCSDRIHVEVIKRVPIKEIEIVDPGMKKILNPGRSYKVDLSITPGNNTYKGDFIFTSDNPEVASVDENGIITTHALGTFSLTATAAEENKTASITLEVKDEYVFKDGVIVEYNGSDPVVTVPLVDNYGNPITEIGKKAYAGNSRLEKVIIPYGIEKVGEAAFEECRILRKATFPSSVTEISNYTFDGCSSLEEVILPENLISIGAYAFSYCAFSNSINLPDTLQSIGTRAFQFSDIAEIVLPPSLKSIGESAFTCLNITHLEIPDSVEEIGAGAFAYTGLKTIKLSRQLTRIEDSTFAYCKSLESITIPDSVTYMGEEVFCECTALESIKLSSRLEYIGDLMFYLCASLKEITLPNTLKMLGTVAFDYCDKLTTIHYEGSREEWDKIRINGILFHKNTPAREVILIDGSTVDLEDYISQT